MGSNSQGDGNGAINPMGWTLKRKGLSLPLLTFMMPGVVVLVNMARDQLYPGLRDEYCHIGTY